MKRIAYICADRGVPVFGRKGCSIHVQEVVRSMMANGAEVELFATRVGGDAPRGLESVPVHGLPRARSKDPLQRERAAIEANTALRDVLAGAGPFDLIYERHSLWSHAGMEHARAAGVPGLLEVNAPLIEEQQRYRRLVLHEAAGHAVARAYAAASALLAVSEGMAAHLELHSDARGRIHVVPNGVDPSRFEPCLARGRDGARPFTVGFVGTLKPWHGVETLVEAFGELHRARADAQLLIVGEGAERETLESIAVRQGVREAVEFTGALDPDRIPDALSRMDVAVAPYPALDGFYFSPLKVFEYMAAGRAIVAASIGQIRSVLVHEATGLLYAAGDGAALALALLRLHDDAPLRDRLGTAARVRTVREHGWDYVARRILDIAARSPRTQVAEEVA